MNYEDDTDNKMQALSVESESKKIENDFICMYQRLPLLWDVNHVDYSNKYKRNAALDKLLVILKKLNHLATRYNVRQKINILRSCYRKELRRHLNSKVIDSNGEVTYEYIPTSWKFHKLRFLDCIEKTDSMNRSDIAEVNIEDNGYEEQTGIQGSDDSLSEQDNADDDGRQEIIINSLSPFSKRKSYLSRHPRKKIKVELNRDEYFEHNVEKDDIFDKEFDAIGANVACKLKRMNPQQRCHAELLINKVLIKGLKNVLTDNTDLTDVWNI